MFQFTKWVSSLSVCLCSLGTIGDLNQVLTPKIRAPVPQVLKQVVSLSCLVIRSLLAQLFFWSSGYYFLGRFISVLEPSLSGIIVLQNALFCLWQYPSRNQTVSIEPNFQSMLKQQVDLAIQSVMEEKSGKRADLWCRAKFTKQLWVM